jgi:LmbE family N-acetylglucosaminyl deacetylase
MKLRRLSLAGFRGFNTPRTIEFDRQLTLISAPNSHGKTSITEAFEFLIYGQTSKVEHADSKDEYKDSYRNRHFPSDSVPYIEAVCEKDEVEIVLRVQLDGLDIQRFVNGKPVTEWPFATELLTAARPFVVQHALKSLLLAAPTERFQGFAQLLGLRDVDAVQQAFVNLCTKPETHLSAEAKRLLTDLDLFVGRLKSNRPTAPVAQALGKGPERLDDAFAKLAERGRALLRRKVADDQLAGALVELRNDAAAKVYAGSVRISSLTTPEQQELRVAHLGIESFLAEDVVQTFGQLSVGNATDRLRKKLNLLGIGIELIGAEPDTCPLCAQELDADRRSALHERHTQLSEQLGTDVDVGAQRARVAARLKQLVSDIELVRKLGVGKSTDLINANSPEASGKIKALIGQGREHELFLIASAGAAIQPHHSVLTEAATKATVAAQVCSDAIHGRSESVAQIEELVLQLSQFLAVEKAYDGVLREVGPTLEQPSQILRAAVDAQAGTTELSLLIEALGAQSNLDKAVRIRAVLESLKVLRKHIDQAVGQTMEDAFSRELTGAVMAWYQRIRTTGDPDVHFSGFEMERTKAGAFKSRRVKVAAHSYGAELASAVSSLSESKLNALGLCMSIATALRSPGPSGFLILDDPIQSWDDDHEVQFIDIVRSLASEEGRQIVLMSHRSSWIDRVAAGCRSLNGRRYHIGGYAQDGPSIAESAWAPVDERLKEALSIANDVEANSVRLQQAEEELRIAACQLVAEVASAKLGRKVGAHGLNSKKCRTILSDAGCETPLTDRVVASFGTTDDAHHAPKDYEPSRERIRQYHGALCELRNWLQKS